MRHRETGIKAANKLSLLHLSLYQLSLRLWGITTPEKTTNRGYDLRSRGPPALDAQALDNLVSRVRRSSSTRSHTSDQSLDVTQPPPSPPPSPPSTSSIMTTKTIDDLATIIEKLVGTMSVLQNDVESLKKDKAPSSSPSGSGGHDGQHHIDRPPRFQKIDFPRFDGKSDPMLFVNRCESYFHQQRIMEEEKVWMASYHLEGVAQSWYLQLQTDEGTPRWHRFKDILQLRFGPPLRSAPLFELAECRRTGTMEEYQNRFQELLPRAGPLEERQRVQLFTGGLLPPLSHAVRIHNPQSLAAAMSLARQVELMELDRAPTPAHIRPAARGVLPPPPKPAPMALPTPHVPLALPAPPAGAAPGRGEGRRLSTEEMAERRRLGLCFNCNDKYSRGHNRFCKRIFFVDGVEIMDEDDTDHPDGPDAEAPCFSLQVVSGCPVADTM
jgi:hypothetical protein